MRDVEMNRKRFPNNVMSPVRLNDVLTDAYDFRDFTMYPFYFNSLYDLYDYLKADPIINSEIWRNHDDIASIEGTYDFAGLPYKEAVETLISGMDPGYEEFLRVEGVMNASLGTIHKYDTIKSVAGGHVNVSLYTAGSPLIYQVSRLRKIPKFINFNIALGYRCGTSKSQVFNKAIIITNLVKAFEQNGYNVDINAFKLGYEIDELIYIVLEIKKHGERMNYEALYKSLCNVEFLRRICFRILETSEVKRSSWSDGYGRTCDAKMSRSALNLDKNDLFFPEPIEMGINGKSLEEDFICAIEYLKLSELIDVNKLKADFKERVKCLKR